ncbi:MAG TPA: monovalent cation/H+ antiporter complex subunit F [Anaerolineae bacterium]|nr:monovalent cation/H+ antiporter complex subunit F [Anaerolineae bacterium]
MSTLLIGTLYFSLAVHTLLIGYAVWRMWRGENRIDRLMGFDLIGTLILGVLVLIAMIEETSIFIDVGLGLTALGFVGVVALARYAVAGEVE